jgi:hypothetical protein
MVATLGTAFQEDRFRDAVWERSLMAARIHAKTHGGKDRRVPFFFVRNDEMHNQEYEGVLDAPCVRAGPIQC